MTLDEALLTARERGVDLLTLDAALEALAGIDPRKSRVVELRYFGGLSIVPARSPGAIADGRHRRGRVAVVATEGERDH